MSDELARTTAPVTLDSLTRSLASAVAAAVDSAALDPTSGAGVGRPASLTSSALELATTGNPAVDAGHLLAAISDGAPVAPVIITGWPRAAQLAPVLDGLQRFGCTVVISPGAGHTLVGLDATGVAIADAGVRITAGTHADVLMDDGSSPAGTTVLRLWQANLVALMGERLINWMARPDAVAWMSLETGSPAE